MSELPFGSGHLASLSHLFESPEAANTKCPFVTAQTIDAGFVPLKQAVLSQSLADEGVGRSYARIVSSLIADAGHQQHAGIDLNSVELPGIGLDFAVETPRIR